MPLKARKPEASAKRLKLFLFGSYKVGKTVAVLHFPRVYVIDGEKGTVHDQYIKLMEANQSHVMHTNDVDEVVEEVRALATEKHEFRTLLIDPITTIESDLIEKAEKEYGAGDMRIWGKRDRKLKRLVNLLNRLDMNVIVTAHGKIDYGQNMTRLGTTFDGWKRWPFEFDLIIELERRGSERVAIVRGSRIETFSDGEVFAWSYDEFRKRYPTIEQESKPLAIASAGQVAELNKLLGIVKLPDGTVEKWLVKAGVETLADMDADTITKCIAHMKGRLPAEPKESK
jgi:hypothetical protein